MAVEQIFDRGKFVVEKMFDQLIRTIERLKYFYLRLRIRALIQKNASGVQENDQDLGIYWDETFAQGVSVWGVDTAWREIQFFLADRKGKVLDIACGSGAVMKVLENLEEFGVYGCDISSYLIEKAVESGISGDRLTVCDARQLPYQDNYFTYSYSIGSLEHFTEDGIRDFIRESYRITAATSFHQVPTSRSGKEEGWIRLGQSYFNNSVEWWLKQFQSSYDRVYVLNSRWEDPISIGRWFVCVKDPLLALSRIVLENTESEKGATA